MGKEAAKFTASVIKAKGYGKDWVWCKVKGQIRKVVYLSNGKMLNEEIVKAGYALWWHIRQMWNIRKYFQRLIEKRGRIWDGCGSNQTGQANITKKQALGIANKHRIEELKKELKVYEITVGIIDLI